MSESHRGLPIHEEHGEVVGTWRELGYERETVVCFDRHLDLKPLVAGAAERLRGAQQSIEQLRQLNRPLPLREAPGAFGLDDFFAAGSILGTVCALHWVMPGRWPDDGVRVRAGLDAIARIAVEPQTLEHTRVVDGVLHTRLCGLDLQVHSLETLRAQGVGAHARVDIDLDWLADGESEPQHTPQELAELLGALECAERVDSLTWSVRSGFLSPSMRGAGSQLAELLGRELRVVPWDDAWTVPERTFAVLRERSAMFDEHELEDELSPLGAIGLTLRGCLHVHAGQLDRAQAAWEQAAEQGVRSSWLAHSLGMAFYPEQLERALQWFEHAIGSGTDTLEAHASTMAILCLLRLDRREEARTRIATQVERYPLDRTLVRLGLLTSQGDEQSRYFDRQNAIEALWMKDVA